MTDDRNDLQGIRINRFIASSGFCSRREADVLIDNGQVTVNGNTVINGTKILPDDLVCVNGKTVFPKNRHLYVALNKPLGITCTTDRRDRDNIIDYLGFEERVFPIGRLDKNSSGLIILTNDGEIVNKVLRAEGGHEKEYEVSVNKPVNDDFISKMQEGIPILGRITLPCIITPTGPKSFRIILTQGLNRQIRRMCEYLGYHVVKLNRIRFLNISLGKMKPGEYRLLNADEIRGLKNAALPRNPDRNNSDINASLE